MLAHGLLMMFSSQTPCPVATAVASTVCVRTRRTARPLRIANWSSRTFIDRLVSALPGLGRLSLMAAVVMAALLVPARAAGPDTRSATASEGGCTLVFGHGRHPSDDEAANRSWDEANRAMASQVAADLASGGRRIVRVLLPVTVTDVPAIVDGMLQRALQQGCGRIVESNLFVDGAADVIVARLRAYAVEPARGAGRPARIGATLYTHQQEYPNTQRHLERLVPATLGKELAADYVQRNGAR